MSEGLEFVVRAVLIGVGATAVLDLWAVLATRLVGFPAPNWGLVGRWVGYFPRRQFVHDNIAEAAPVRGELMIGWATHYGTDVIMRLCFWRYGVSAGRVIRPSSRP